MSLDRALALLFAALFVSWALADILASKSSTAVVGLIFIVPMSLMPAALGFAVGRGIQRVLDHLDKDGTVPIPLLLGVGTLVVVTAVWWGAR